MQFWLSLFNFGDKGYLRIFFVLFFVSCFIIYLLIYDFAFNMHTLFAFCVIYLFNLNSLTCKVVPGFILKKCWCYISSLFHPVHYADDNTYFVR